MTPPEWLASVVLLSVLAWLTGAAVARASRPYLDLRVGRQVLELASRARSGQWEGERAGLRLRAQLNDDGTWDVSRWRGQAVSEAHDLTDDQAERLIAEWWGGSHDIR